MVLLLAQRMDVAGIAKVALTSEDRVRNVIHNFNADGFSSLAGWDRVVSPAGARWRQVPVTSE
jgi:hypothetical protein